MHVRSLNLRDTGNIDSNGIHSLYSGYLKLNNSLFKRELLHQMIGGVGVRCGGSMSAFCGDRTHAGRKGKVIESNQLSKKACCGPADTAIVARQEFHRNYCNTCGPQTVACRLWARSDSSEVYAWERNRCALVTEMKRKGTKEKETESFTTRNHDARK